MESLGVNVEDVLDRTMWKIEIRNISGTPQVMGKAREEEYLLTNLLTADIEFEAAKYVINYCTMN